MSNLEAARKLLAAAKKLADSEKFLDTLASEHVGTATSPYFVSSQAGVVAVFKAKNDAVAFAKPRDYLVEGPRGNEYESSWSNEPAEE